MNKPTSNSHHWFNRYFSHPEAVALVVIFTLSMFIFKIIGNILAPIMISIVIAYLLTGGVEFLVKFRCPRKVAVASMFVLFVTFLLLVLFWVLPILWNEIIKFAAEIPNLLNRSQELALRIHNMFPTIISVKTIESSISMLVNQLMGMGKYLLTFSLVSLISVATTLVYLVLVPLLVFFLLKDGKDVINWIAKLLPEKHHRLAKLWNELKVKIRCYVNGKLLEIVVIALVSIIVFRILGLRYAILLGCLSGLSVLVPYVGIISVTIPITVVGIMQWGFEGQFFHLLIVHAVINFLDANLLVPLLFSGIMSLHPLAIILAVFIFGSLFGFWGVFFAIPLMTMANLVRESWPVEN